MPSILSRLVGAPPAPLATDPPEASPPAPAPIAIALPTLDGLEPLPVPAAIDAALVKVRTARKDAERTPADAGPDETRAALAQRLATLQAQQVAGLATADDVAGAEALLADYDRTRARPPLALLHDGEFLAKEAWREAFNSANARRLADALDRITECTRLERDLTAALQAVRSRSAALADAASNLYLNGPRHRDGLAEVSIATRIAHARDLARAERAVPPTPEAA